VVVVHDGAEFGGVPIRVSSASYGVEARGAALAPAMVVSDPRMERDGGGA
jgi:hypothetical protein